jgi:hypothetical protein
LGGLLIENVPFSAFDLEKYGQGHTFSRSKYQKRVVGEKLKILSYHTHKSDVWFFSVGRSKRKFHDLSANCILQITAKVMHFQGQNTIVI